MEPVEYIRGIRRRWKVIVASVVVALAVGLIFSGGGGGTAASPTRTTYRARTYLMSTSSVGSIGRAPSSLATVATIATLGEVPRRVADALPFEIDPTQLTSTVTVIPDDTTGLLGISVTAPTASRAKLVADTYAKELLSFLSDRTLEQAEDIQRKINRLDRQIAAQDGGSTDSTDTSAASDKSGGGAAATETQGSLELQRSAYQQQLATLLASTGGDLSGFQIVEPAEAVRVAPDAGIQAPRSRWLRLLIAVGIGLLLGIVLALLLERFDTKLRSRDQVEEILRLPVLGEIPKVSRRHREIVLETAPTAPASNAYRFLAAALQLGRHEEAEPTNTTNGHRTGNVFLVTSALAAEGKSTIVSNLAVAFAELGKSVIVMCCDFPHPTAHETFGVDEGPGLTEVLQGDDGAADSFLQSTRFGNVRVLSTGELPYRSGMLGVDQMAGVLAGLRSSADVVLIDTAPLFAESDWTHLVPDLDSVLLVLRAGATEAAVAQRAVEMLAILHAPLVGVALTGTATTSVKGTGYGYQAASKRALPRREEERSEPAPADAVADGDQNGQGVVSVPDEAEVAEVSDSG